LAVLFVVLLVAIYLEFKYLRPRRRDDIEMVLTQDDAYNAITSTKAVSNSLKGMGKQTGLADAMLLKAEMEYERKDYVKSIATAKAARDALLQAKDVEVFEEKPQPSPGMAVESEEEPAPEEKTEDKTVHEVKKLPPNYLESKFLIETTKEDVEKAKEAGRDCSDAEMNLSESEKCFENKDYSAALRCCMKAKRSLAGKGKEAAAPERPAEQPVPSEPAKTEVPEKETTSTGVRCQKCGATANEDDNFCPKCGSKIERQDNCRKCGTPISLDDAFCRKCGEKLG
jgi:hypothetical protein